MTKRAERQNMKFQTKSLPFEVKSIDDEKNIFEGYASVFRNVDSYGDIVEPGAFTKTIQERGDKVKVLWQHDPYTPIGKAVHLEEDNHGLYVKAQIFDTVAGQDAMKLIKGGVIDELSIGYRTIKDEWDKERNARILKEVQLFEFSPVTFAANSAAMITAAKNDDLTSALLELNNELKAGKVLSEKNKTLVKNAIEALQALLNAAGADDEEKGGQNPDVKEIMDLINEMKTYK